MAYIKGFARQNRRLLLKTGSYYVMHVTVAAAVGFAVTGSLAMAVALSLLEPTVQAVAFFFHERAWSSSDDRVSAGAPRAA